jgi:hypothetical protein
MFIIGLGGQDGLILVQGQAFPHGQGLAPTHKQELHVYKETACDTVYITERAMETAFGNRRLTVIIFYIHGFPDAIKYKKFVLDRASTINQYGTYVL